MKSKLFIIIVIFFLSNSKLYAQHGCYIDAQKRIYTKRSGSTIVGKYYLKNPSYSLVPIECPEAQLLLNKKTACYVDNAQGFLHTYRRVAECDLDKGTWVLIMITGLIGFVYLKRFNNTTSNATQAKNITI